MADLHLLRTFLAVYRAGTFTRAAQELHLTQPAVSVQIQSLERQVGKPLFRRVARGATPTAAGRELAQAVAAHIDALEGALDPGRDAPNSIGDSVHLGGPEQFLTERVLPVVAPLLDEGLRMRMFFDVDAPVVERLAAGELDLAVLTTNVPQRGIETQSLCYEYLDLVGAPRWKRMLESITFDAAGAARLAEVPIAAYDEDLPLVGQFWRDVFGVRPEFRARFVANGLGASLRFAASGAGITVLPSHSCAEAIERGELVRVIEPGSAPRSRLYLAWRAGSLRRRSLARVHARISDAGRTW